MMIAPARNMIGGELVHAPGDQQIWIQAALLHSAEGNTSFTLYENTSLTLSKFTTLAVKGNLRLHNDIRGEGLVVLSGNSRSSLDANGNSIPRLMLCNPAGVELLSRLNISGELILDQSDLLLGNFDLILTSPFARITTLDGGQIAFNGSGRIIGQSLQPLANNAPANDRDLSSQVLLDLPDNTNPLLYGTQVVYYINTDCEITFLSPPSPPPD